MPPPAIGEDWSRDFSRQESVAIPAAMDLYPQPATEDGCIRFQVAFTRSRVSC